MSKAEIGFESGLLFVFWIELFIEDRQNYKRIQSQHKLRMQATLKEVSKHYSICFPNFLMKMPCVADLQSWFVSW